MSKMKNKIKLDKGLFPVLSLTLKKKNQLAERNRTIDYYLEKGLDVPKSMKKDSIYRLTIMHGPKICNFNCPKYCCTEGIAKGQLNKEQLKKVIDQASNIGIKVTYWPGLGELTLLKDFWEIQDYLKEKDIKSVVFTNGSAFWNNDLAKEYTGMKSSELIKKVKDLGIHLYIKYWNSNPKKAAKMAGINPHEYPFIRFKGKNIPLALSNLMQEIPRERLGVETMVSKENYDDVIRNIIPTINELDLYGYLEPVIFSGKAEGKQKNLALSPNQYLSLADIFVSGGNYCEKRQSVELILVGNRMSPGIVIPPREKDKVIDKYGNVSDILKIFHNPYFRKIRRISERLDGCICRAIWEGEIKL